MKNLKKIAFLSILFTLLFSFSASTIAQEAEGYIFTDQKVLKTTSVKDQYRSGTCWSFSGLSFFESELLRLGKPEVNLSEMFVVRHCYSEKAQKYVRLHGSLNFGGGGAFVDVQNTLKNIGIVPEEVFKGLAYGTDKHVHGEFDAVLKGYIDAVLENSDKTLSTAWHSGFDGILDAYLGVIPENFSYNGKQYTAQSFAKELGLNMDDYIHVTSFTHHPFYKPFILEVPDNWNWGQVYNLPLDEMIQVIDNALDKGYTVAWASDVSEKGFGYSKGVAVVPEVDFSEMNGLEQAKWELMPQRDRDAIQFALNAPGKEKVITQEIRQAAFDNYETTDDHGMHIIGWATDQNGTKYYKVKNSWNVGNVYEGYFYVSVPFVKYKTMSLMIHKDAVPNAIRQKCGF